MGLLGGLLIISIFKDSKYKEDLIKINLIALEE